MSIAPAAALARQLVLVIALAAMPLTARADPLLMFLVGFAQNLIESSAAAKPGYATAKAPLPPTYPGTMVQPEHLQRLVDDCFMYLSQAQRDEIFEKLHAELLKPGNALVRGDMIRYFAQTALQVRALQIRLGQLSGPEKELLAREFGGVVLRLPPQERSLVEQIVEQRLLPLPSDIGDLIAAQVTRDRGVAGEPSLPLNGSAPMPSPGAAAQSASELALQTPR